MERCFRALLDSGSAPHILLEGLVEMPSVQSEFSSSHIVSITSWKSAMVGKLTVAPSLNGRKVVTIDVLVVERSSYDPIIVYPMVKQYIGFLDWGNLMASFIIEQEREKIAIDPD